MWKRITSMSMVLHDSEVMVIVLNLQLPAIELFNNINAWSANTNDRYVEK